MKQKVNILSVKFGSDYIIYCPFQLKKQIFYIVWQSGPNSSDLWSDELGTLVWYLS